MKDLLKSLRNLGHASRISSAPLYNFGLAAAGFLIVVYAAMVFRRHAKYASFCLAVTAFMLQLVLVVLLLSH